MLYEFNCPEHGNFIKRQDIHDAHVAYCSECGKLANRVFGQHEVIWAGTVYRPDGSRREQDDYAILKG